MFIICFIRNAVFVYVLEAENVVWGFLWHNPEDILPEERVRRHTVHLEVSSILPQSVCLLHSFPHIIKPPSHCFISLFFSSFFQPHLLGVSVCVWDSVFLFFLHASAVCPNCEFHPQMIMKARYWERWWSYVQHTYLCLHVTLSNILYAYATLQDRVITIRTKA